MSRERSGKEKEMGRPNHLVILLYFLFFSSSSFSLLDHQIRHVTAQNATALNVGVVLDFGSLPGKKNWVSISMAVDEFYAVSGNLSKRVVLHPSDSQGDIVGAALAAQDLLKNVKAQAIIGPYLSSQTEFIANLSNKTRVPVISFSATSPSLSSIITPYFVRATLNDSYQAGAIAAIIGLYKWLEVALVYEDTNYGSGIISSLMYMLNSMGTRVRYLSVVPPLASDDWVAMELHRLMSMQARVFVVHIMPELGSRLFRQARTAGLMSPGYVWLATDGLTDVLDSMDPTTIASMEGLLGVRAHVPQSSALASFTGRWQTRFSRDNPTDTTRVYPTVHQLRAYDAAWALALAVNKTGKIETGPALLRAIRSTQFRGLAGDFRLVDGQLQPSSGFEIVNVIGKGGRAVGFWTPEVGIRKELKDSSDAGLKPVMWPGDTTVVPKGWEAGKTLRIGVQVNRGFKQFAYVETDNVTGVTRISGYFIDVFNAVIDALPYSVLYEYVLFTAESENDFLSLVYSQRFEALVGDIPKMTNWSMFVDFTLPYTVSGVSMIVPVKEDKNKKSPWIFFKPLAADLWLGSLAFFFFTGFVIWVTEHRTNEDFQGPPSQQIRTTLFVAFSTMVFAHDEKIKNNLTKFTVIVWLFVVQILTSSYIASLTSMLTVQQLQPAVTDVSELIKNGDYVGYQDGSFVGEMLKHQLKFDESKLRKYNAPEQYAEALSLGSENGGVSAIFDEVPFLKLFLSDRCDDYAMVGEIYRTTGFGFLRFSSGSPLVADVSRAILSVTEKASVASIDKKWFGDQITCPNGASSLTSSSLHLRSFGGLFLITGCVSSLALLYFLITFVYKKRDALMRLLSESERSPWKRMIGWTRGSHDDRQDLDSHRISIENGATTGRDGGSNEDNLVESTIIVISDLFDMNDGSSDEGRPFSVQGEPVLENQQYSLQYN